MVRNTVRGTIFFTMRLIIVSYLFMRLSIPLCVRRDQAPKDPCYAATHNPPPWQGLLLKTGRAIHWAEESALHICRYDLRARPLLALEVLPHYEGYHL